MTRSATHRADRRPAVGWWPLLVVLVVVLLLVGGVLAWGLWRDGRPYLLATAEGCPDKQVSISADPGITDAVSRLLADTGCAQ